MHSTLLKLSSIMKIHLMSYFLRKQSFKFTQPQQIKKKCITFGKSQGMKDQSQHKEPTFLGELSGEGTES